jgi:hypothetical protein
MGQKQHAKAGIVDLKFRGCLQCVCQIFQEKFWEIACNFGKIELMGVKIPNF